MKPEEYLRPDVISSIHQFDLKAKFIIKGFMAGMHAAINKGFSVEFSDHRQYIHGDDPRLIDWNVHARTDKYYIRRYQAETTRDTHIIVDASASMSYHGPGATMTKYDYAICVAAALTWLMIEQQDPVGLFHATSTGINRLKPGTARRHLHRMLSALAGQPPGGVVNIAETVSYVCRHVSRQGMVVLLSDFIMDSSEIETALAMLKHRGHDVILFHVIDAAEWRLPFDGKKIFRDPETGREITADPDVVRQSYRDAIHAHSQSIETACKRMSADYILLDTATGFDKALISWLRRRSKA